MLALEIGKMRLGDEETGAERDDVPEEWGFGEHVARRKLGALPEGWRVFRWERIGPDGAVYEGGVPKVIATGRRAGERTWKGQPTLKAVVTDDEIRAAELDYERKTGKCARCRGTGKRWQSWNRETGHKFVDCENCGATGKTRGCAATDEEMAVESSGRPLG